MSAWYGIWHGYPFQTIGPDDVERFRSLEHATTALRDRYSIGSTLFQAFDYVHKPAERVLTPGVTEGSEILLYPTPDAEHPVRRVFFGPRGGVRIERL